MNLKTARSIDEAFVAAAEANLATLEDLLLLQKQSKARVARQRDICLDMLRVSASPLLNAREVRWGTGNIREFPRVTELSTNSDPAAIEVALDSYIERIRAPKPRTQVDS